MEFVISVAKRVVRIVFVSDRLLYVAMPKTASTHIESLLGKLINGSHRAKHSLVAASDFIEGRRFIGSIRSPWSYYVSLWAWGCRGRGGIRHTIDRHPISSEVYGDASDSSRFRSWLRLVLFDHEALRGGPGLYHGSALAGFAGLATMRYCEYFLAPQTRTHYRQLPDIDALCDLARRTCFIDDFITQENLEPDLLAALRRCGIETTREQRALICGEAKTNVSTPLLPLAHYYDEETILLVAERDRYVAERFGYSWDGTQVAWEKPAIKFRSHIPDSNP